MKKKFKKLSLSTETLRSLDPPDLQNVAGGHSHETLVCTLCTAVPCTLCTVNCSLCTRCDSACNC
jgi:hypothetical protein